MHQLWKKCICTNHCNLLGRCRQCSDPGPDSCIRSRNSCRRFLVFLIQLFSSTFYVILKNPKISTLIGILLFFTHKQFCCVCRSSLNWFLKSRCEHTETRLPLVALWRASCLSCVNCIELCELAFSWYYRSNSGWQLYFWNFSKISWKARQTVGWYLSCHLLEIS